MSQPTLLVIGAAGQLGSELRRQLASIGPVVALDRTNCDLTHVSQVREVLHAVRPDVTVNAAGYTDVDKAETEAELAFAVNGAAVRVLAEESRAAGSLLVHYSTDYVFDGFKAQPVRTTPGCNTVAVTPLRSRRRASS